MENEGSKRLKRIFGACLLIGAAGLASPSAWAAGPKVTVNIPAGNAGSTLLEFYQQSRVQVLYLSQVVENIQTKAISGEFEASEALEQMLAGTGLVFEFESDYSVVVHRPTETHAQQPGSTESPGMVTAIPEQPPQNAIVPPSSGTTEVLVTGSHIRGVLDVMSPLEILTQQEMKQTAYATIQDAVQTLPLNLGVAQGEDFSGTGNFGRGTALNLRGLGAGATLVLVNGRRQPQAGIQADFVDVSNIPWSAVDRIEVLPDGTSALYGSDAIAGVVNIIMRDDLDGAESMVRMGTAPGGAAETMVGQSFGNRWQSGKWLANYQYSQRTALAATERAYSANTDKRPLGGNNFSTFRSNPGNILNPATFQPAFAIPSGQNGSALTLSDLIPGAVNFQNKYETYQLLPSKEIHSLYFSGEQDIGQRFQIFGEARLSQRDMQWQSFAEDRFLLVPSTNPYYINPYGGTAPVIVAYNFLDDLGPITASGRTRNQTETLGLKAKLNKDWQATLSTSHAKESLHWLSFNQIDPSGIALNRALADPNPATAFNPFGDGPNTNPATIESIRTTRWNRSASEIVSANIVADGPLLDLPAGTAKLAVGAESRVETLNRTLIGRDFAYRPQRFDRRIEAAFAELSVPLQGKPNDARAVPHLELSLAGRYEQYSDFGNTFNPKLGLRWAPLKSVKLRTSWGTSFKAPKLVDLYDTSQNAVGPALFPDPLSPTRQSFVLLQQGNNEDLKEETASTWTVGLDLTPAWIPGLTLSLTGYATEYAGQVIQPGGLSLFDILSQEDRWSEVITRNPSQALIDSICNSPDLIVPAAQCKAIVPTAFIDIRLRNLATTRVKGADLTLDLPLSTGLGAFNFELSGSYIFSFEQAFTKTSPTVDILDTYSNPLALRIRSTVEWNQVGKFQPGFGASFTLDHKGSYRNPGSSIRQDISALTTLDMQLSYRTKSGNGWLDNVELVLNATNLLDQDPPFVDNEYGYDNINAEPTGRVISLYLLKNWGHR